MTKQEALDILHAALSACLAAGIDVQVGPLYHAAYGASQITLNDVIVVDGKLVVKP